jgi:hypothetical protein
MAGSGRSESVRNCGKVYFSIVAVILFVISLILIGLAVRVCDMVSLKSNQEVLYAYRKNTAYVSMEMRKVFIVINCMKEEGTGWGLV